MKHALRKSLDTSLDIFERINAVRNLIGIDIKRDNMALANSIISNRDLTDEKIRVRVNDSWTTGTILNIRGNMATLMLDNQDTNTINLVKSIKSGQSFALKRQHNGDPQGNPPPGDIDSHASQIYGSRAYGQHNVQCED